MGKNKKKLIPFKKPILGRLFKWVIFPIVLLLLWICTSIVYSSYNSFTVLQYSHREDIKNNLFDKKLLKGQKLTGQFTAYENNLGIIEIKIGYVPRVDYTKEDVLVFRIKQENQKGWSIVNKYRSGAIYSNGYFPFGFSPIKNSKGKTYEFEIESLDGNEHNAVETGHINPVYLSKYKFSKSEIFNNPISIIKFAVKKVTTFLTSRENIRSSFVFLIPLLFYFAVLLGGELGVYKNKKLFVILTRYKKNKTLLIKNLFAIFVAVLIFTDMFFPRSIFNGFALVLFALWCIAVLLNRFESRISFIFAFLLILMSVAGIYFGGYIIVDKSSSFTYFLIVLGFVQGIYEKDSKPKRK